MPGVPRELAEHSLNVIKGSKPVKQATRRFGDERRKAIGKEINRLKVTFGPKENYRSEFLRFEVFPFKNAYHAIFG